MRILNNACELDNICLITFIADILKAFDSVDPLLLMYVIKKQYGIDGKLLRFIKSIVQNNIIIVKDGRLYSSSVKEEKSSPQVSQLPVPLSMYIMILLLTKWNLYELV